MLTNEILNEIMKFGDTAKIKKCVPVECFCRLWKIYLPLLGFIYEIETTDSFE